MELVRFGIGGYREEQTELGAIYLIHFPLSMELVKSHDLLKDDWLSAEVKLLFTFGSATLLTPSPAASLDTLGKYSVLD